jgi:hypothetical protein
MEALHVKEFYSQKLTECDIPRFYHKTFAIIRHGEVSLRDYDPLGPALGAKSAWMSVGVSGRAIWAMHGSNLGWYNAISSVSRINLTCTAFVSVRHLSLSFNEGSTGRQSHALTTLGLCLAATSELEDLDLRFQEDQFEGVQHSGDEVDKSFCLAIFPVTVHFPRLKRLSFFGFVAEEVELTTFLGKHSGTLTCLNLTSVLLVSAPPSHATPCWVRTIKFLQRKFKLAEVCFGVFLGNCENQN